MHKVNGDAIRNIPCFQALFTDNDIILDKLALKMKEVSFISEEVITFPNCSKVNMHIISYVFLFELGNLYSDRW